MRRYDKEICKQIEDLEVQIQVDYELGMGYMPSGAHDTTYDKIHKLQTKMAQSHGYNTAEDMYWDAQTKFEQAMRGMRA